MPDKVGDLFDAMTEAEEALNRALDPDVWDATGEQPTGEELDKLASDLSWKRRIFEIACDYGRAAAMLFKLSDGGIDPRPTSVA